jgi:hypothetical protein
MLADDHPGYLMPVKLRREAGDVARSGDRDVVVQESDLVPTMQARQQESNIAFCTQVACSVGVRTSERLAGRLGRKLRMAPVLWDLNDERSRPGRSRYPPCGLVGPCVLAAEDDEQNAEPRGQVDGRLKA